MLIVETGSGSAASESYVSVSDAIEYAISHGLDFSGSSYEAALRRATAYIDFKYRLRFPGFRKNRHLQALEWPRAGAYYYTPSYIGESPYFVDPNAFYPFDFIEPNTIPIEIINATCVAATIELATPGSLITNSVTTAATSGGAITKIKAGSVEIDYSAGSPLTFSSGSSGSSIVVGEPILAVLSGLLSPGTSYTARAARA